MTMETSAHKKVLFLPPTTFYLLDEPSECWKDSRSNFTLLADCMRFSQRIHLFEKVISNCKILIIRVKMYRLVYDEKEFFTRIKNCSNEEDLRTKVLTKMTKLQTEALAVLALNTLFGAVSIGAEKRRILQPLKPFFRAISDEDIGPGVRKKIALAHAPEVLLLVTTLYKNVNDLIWRAEQEETPSK